MFDPAVVRYGQQPNPGYEAKHEGPPKAPYATPCSLLPTPDSRLPFLKPEPKPLSTEFFVRILELKWLSQ
ncbi:MAG: hypothetical protein F6K37_21620 [Moorea sp. SIO4E2]|uniref:hypothetical protein n=1 Tax=Moorena producens TaxID=1155739 RepID=UPI0002DC55F1|nr:hypothetical protein [Moorena producens]NEP67395.1 hypothetical protein [Moorena sp. SIO3A5]NEQ08447.1 hypothetical protein [Moorena sp. SIO4E2]